MNPAITAALIAAKNSHPPSPVDRLTEAGAVSAEKAIAIDPATPDEQKQLDQATKFGLILRRADGRLFVNRRAVEERNARIGYHLLLGVLVALSIFASVAALLIFAAR